jgi:hypothetical protein
MNFSNDAWVGLMAEHKHRQTVKTVSDTVWHTIYHFKPTIETHKAELEVKYGMP